MKSVLQQIIEIMKGNDATTLSVGGVLQPGQAQMLMSLVVDQSKFMQRVTVLRSNKLSFPVPIFNLGSRKLVRITEGTEASASNDSTNVGKLLTLKAVDLLYDLYYSFILNNLDNPNVEKLVTSDIAVQLANDILDLATNGTSETYSPSFVTLNKGWMKTLKDSADANKVDLVSSGGSNNYDSMQDLFSALLRAMPDKYKTPQCAFAVSPTRFEDYCREIGNKPGMGQILLNGDVATYLGYSVVPNPFIPVDATADNICGTNEYLFGDLKRLLVAYSTVDVQRSVVDKPRKKSFEYTYSVPVDFEIAGDEAMVIAYNS